MKDTPIVILNRDRLTPVKKLIKSLYIRGYYNITIIDNGSTYIPLLRWYEEMGIDVFFNHGIVVNDCYALNALAYEVRHPKFLNITNQYFCYTDSDLYPIDETPENFIDDMILLVDKYKVQKIGMSIKIDDLDLTNPLLKHVYDYEITYWENPIQDPIATLYPHPIDTTFSVYAPGAPAKWSSQCLRIGLPYTLRHEPFYYTKDNMPEDEIYYLKHQNSASSNWSSKVKASLGL